MKKAVLTIAVISGALLMSCNNNRNNQQATRPAEQFTTPAPATTPEPIVSEEVVSNYVTDNQGRRMDLVFNNTRGTATVNLDGETINMVQDTMASGIRMHNDEYEYEEWQGHVVLKRDGQVIFDNKNNINTVGANTNANNKLNITYNNNNNTATVRINGQNIVLRADTTASGLRYSNNEYVYEEWKGHGVLKRNGDVVFDSNN